MNTEEHYIGSLVGLLDEPFIWCGPGTWAALAGSVNLDDTERYGNLGDFSWAKPYPFSMKIFMNPFAEEGRIYLSRAGAKYFEYAVL